MASKKAEAAPIRFTDQELWKSYGKAREEEMASRNRRVSFERARMSASGIPVGSEAWDARLGEIETESDKYLNRLSSGAMAKQLNESFESYKYLREEKRRAIRTGKAYEDARKRSAQGKGAGFTDAPEFSFASQRDEMFSGIGKGVSRAATGLSERMGGGMFGDFGQSVYDALGLGSNPNRAGSYSRAGYEGIHDGNPFGGSGGDWAETFQSFEGLVRSNQDVAAQVFGKSEFKPVKKKGDSFSVGGQREFVLKPVYDMQGRRDEKATQKRYKDAETRFRNALAIKRFNPAEEPATMEEYMEREYGKPWTMEGKSAEDKAKEKARVAASGSKGAGGQATPRGKAKKATRGGVGERVAPAVNFSAKQKEDEKERNRSPWI